MGNQLNDGKSNMLRDTKKIHEHQVMMKFFRKVFFSIHDTVDSNKVSI